MTELNEAPATERETGTFQQMYDSAKDTVTDAFSSGSSGRGIVEGAILFGLAAAVGCGTTEHHHHYHNETPNTSSNTQVEREAQNTRDRRQEMFTGRNQDFEDADIKIINKYEIDGSLSQGHELMEDNFFYTTMEDGQPMALIPCSPDYEGSFELSEPGIRPGYYTRSRMYFNVQENQTIIDFEYSDEDLFLNFSYNEFDGFPRRPRRNWRWGHNRRFNHSGGHRRFNRSFGGNRRRRYIDRNSGFRQTFRDRLRNAEGNYPDVGDHPHHPKQEGYNPRR